ncbi:MAG: hypothetical protein LKI34_08600 [Bifidobacterium tibiigranuli]|jgi:hypothetical protein|uniref:hypothetical protein n=1 Tax=Bifidobacterium tibiigranuli TaxID=2172043 RepID=UPI0026E93E09|nr:hypothetical protein [Bifidobacterium tibiigranuli]MCI1674255.1 hypothetical protein [Bifidobacterium tibiigranuli]MCI1713465.1 hypothetical protein [Bifidobacterium tibiigranuli]
MRGFLLAGAVNLALVDPKPCLIPGMDGPVTTALGWIKGIALIIAIVSVVRVGVHMLKQQGDGVPDRDDTVDKLVNVAIGVFFISAAVSILAGLGMSMASC